MSTFDHARNDKFRAIGAAALHRIPQANKLSEEARHTISVVSKVLPFRVNSHVTSHLIDWDAAPDDPLYRLIFPAREMLAAEDFATIERLVLSEAPASEIQASAARIRARLNPDPSGQREANVPMLSGERLLGFQHKYRETVLYFPARGQTCHAYCTFCFRWAQFVGDTSLKFASKELNDLTAYLEQSTEVTDILLTGGDPMIMSSSHLSGILERLAEPRLDHVQNIRIGTKSLSFWPQRFVSDVDADDLLRSIDAMRRAGKTVAIMAHVNHWRELDNPVAHEAIRRLRSAGASIYSQAPLLAKINDDSEIWSRNWREQVKLGIQPYYMFVERDTGPRHYFEVPLSSALAIYRNAISQVSGLARTARGPVMSAHPGKVELLDVEADGDREIFLCQFLQSRIPELSRRPFQAIGKRGAVWYDDLERIENDEPVKRDRKGTARGKSLEAGRANN